MFKLEKDYTGIIINPCNYTAIVARSSVERGEW